VSFGSNNLLKDYNPTAWSDSQQEKYDLVKSLQDEGLGYRRIAQHLNARGIKTIRGNEWESNNVHSVLKRNRERLKRLEVKEEESEIEYGKMELVWLREGESYH
tara:strand:+ start:1017 stop:1328 length:312 start_codon:yes stop_codon:yes gene_type:complete